MSSKVFSLYQSLTEAFGPSGREADIRERIAVKVADYVDEITTDALGNLICRKKGIGKKVMLAAHMDSIGIVATFIDEKGFIRFSQVGGLNPHEIISGKVRFANGVRGVISYEEKTPTKALTMDHLFVDIGAKNQKDAQKLISIGDFAVFDAIQFEQNGVICGPYMDNRIGCAALIMTLEQMQETENDVYVVFTVQEEVGLRGAGSAAFAVHPDVAINVDVTDTGDLPEQGNHMQVQLGGGPAIKIMDRSVICAPSVCTCLEEVAAAQKINVQKEILRFGGTDTAAIQKVHAGVLTGAVSIPCRYLHTPSEMCSIDDVKRSAKLLAHAVAAL